MLTMLSVTGSSFIDKQGYNEVTCYRQHEREDAVYGIWYLVHPVGTHFLYNTVDHRVIGSLLLQHLKLSAINGL